MDAPEQDRKHRTRVIAASVAAVAIFTVLGFGGTVLVRAQIGGTAASAIPSPPPANDKFVEDDDGTGADSEANILQSTVPGLVRVTSARGSGTGVVLTRSGLVLTSAQAVAGPGAATARVLPSGHAYRVTVVGADPARGLALLQLRGAPPGTPVAVGTIRGFGAGAAATAVSAGTSGRAYTLAVGEVTSTNAATTVAGRRLTGLLRTTAQTAGGRSAGEPVVNLSGQVVGIDVAGPAPSAGAASYAVPIDEALRVARQLTH